MNPQASMTGVEWAALVLQVVATLAAAAAAIAARRSVSLTRQLAMFLIVLGPSANSAATAAVIAASGM